MCTWSPLAQIQKVTCYVQLLSKSCKIVIIARWFRLDQVTNQDKKVRHRVQHSRVKYSFSSTSINQFASGLPSSRYLPGKIRLRIIEIYGFLFNFLINFQVILFLSIKRRKKGNCCSQAPYVSIKMKWVSAPLSQPRKYRSNEVGIDKEALQTDCRQQVKTGRSWIENTDKDLIGTDVTCNTVFMLSWEFMSGQMPLL